MWLTLKWLDTARGIPMAEWVSEEQVPLINTGVSTCRTSVRQRPQNVRQEEHLFHCLTKGLFGKYDQMILLNVSLQFLNTDAT